MPTSRPWPLEAAIFYAMAAFAGVAMKEKRPAARVQNFPRRQDRLKILIVTDAWAPQVNGVVRTLESTARELTALGHEVRFATPQGHTTLPLPTYPEIRLALFPGAGIANLIDAFRPDAIHIATEGTMGFSARAICLQRGLPFTTSFHTRFPQYVHARFPFIPESAVMGALRTFHAAASAVMAATPSLRRELESHGFEKVRLWSRGVDVEAFKPGARDAFTGLPRPVFLTVGRIAVEKNVDAFLALDLPGSKVVVGDGPQRAELLERYPEVHFPGRKSGAELASLYASADVFVFPSRTDTFGLVLLEALASGTPVAAYPVQAPLEVIGDAAVAVLDEDLRAASLAALALPRAAARDFALAHSWRASAEQFLGNLAVFGEAKV
jgi:1,2-diacylglycerol 3-alpha-glucosyltransferase/glucuronosyltransferase